MNESPLVYVIYGTPGSGRREVIFDLIDGGIDPKSNVLFFRPEGETQTPFDEQIDALENTTTIEWSLDNAKIKHGQISAAPDYIIFLAAGESDPSDIAEALKSWIDHNNCQIGRLITVVNCTFLQHTPAAQSWYDACIHFSDAVLLNRRDGADNKWIKDFQQGYQKRCSPARFILVKKGKVANPLEVLDPEARRLSFFFDELLPIEEDGLDEEEQPDDIKPDKYIERLESGHRAHPVPDIRKLL